jgi:hypothetical protein
MNSFFFFLAAVIVVADNEIKNRETQKRTNRVINYDVF